MTIDRSERIPSPYGWLVAIETPETESVPPAICQGRAHISMRGRLTIRMKINIRFT